MNACLAQRLVHLGASPQALQRLAAARHAVVGSHGRRGVGRVLLGSDAEQIVRHAPVPVVRGAVDGVKWWRLV